MMTALTTSRTAVPSTAAQEWEPRTGWALFWDRIFDEAERLKEIENRKEQEEDEAIAQTED